MNTMKTFLLMGILTVMLVFIGRLLAAKRDDHGFVLAAVMILGPTGSATSCLRMYKASLSPRLTPLTSTRWCRS